MVSSNAAKNVPSKLMRVTTVSAVVCVGSRSIINELVRLSKATKAWSPLARLLIKTTSTPAMAIPGVLAMILKSLLSPGIATVAKALVVVSIAKAIASATSSIESLSLNGTATLPGVTPSSIAVSSNSKTISVFSSSTENVCPSTSCKPSTA